MHCSNVQYWTSCVQSLVVLRYYFHPWLLDNMHVRGQKTITDYEVIVMKTYEDESMLFRVCLSWSRKNIETYSVSRSQLFFVVFFGGKIVHFYSQSTLWRNLEKLFNLYRRNSCWSSCQFFTVKTSILYSCFILIQVDILCLYRHFSMWF